ncbi:MAG: toll/interleukin-1 receptor domain-containing protein [Candidatus Thiodiazotropha endolucinida]
MISVFISYSQKDREFVKQLARDLEFRVPEIRIFYDLLMPAGSSWADTLSKEIESADIVLAILSPDYLVSEWGRKEAEVAMLRMTEGKSRLIPLMYRHCDVTGFLSSITWVDFTSEYEEGFSRLVWGITGQRPSEIQGEEPGSARETVIPAELDSLRAELRAAVDMFKSKSEDKIESQDNGSEESGDNVCFIVMPFGDSDLEVVYEDFVKPVIEQDCGLICERGDDVFGSNVIMDDILQSIQKAKVVLADLTKKNANVFYEVGICHAFNKPVLLLAQSIDDVPFDLRHRRVLIYDYTPRGCKRLESSLKENMDAVLGNA